MLTNDEQTTRDFYNANAGNWAAKHHDGNFWRIEKEKFRTFLPAGKIIDLGCGGGNDTAWFLDNHYQYLGVDESVGMLEQAHMRNPTAEYAVKDFYGLNFAKGEFDGFWAACSLLHVPKEKIAQVLSNIKNIIKPHGVGFISLKEGNTEGPEQGIDMEGARFFAHYEEYEFKSILEANGFTVLETGKKINTEEPKVVFVYYFVQS